MIPSTFTPPDDVTIVANGARVPALPWLGAALVATLATGTLFEARPGINVLIVMIAATAFAWYLDIHRGNAWTFRSRVVELLLLPLAGCCALSSDAHLLGVLGVAIVWLAAMAAVGSESRILLGRLAVAPLAAVARVMAHSRVELGLALLTLRTGRHTAVFRGMAWAAPTVVLFYVLLARADTTLESWQTAILASLQSLSFLPRLLFWTLCFVLLLGRLAMPRHPPGAAFSAGHTSTASPRASAIERGIVLASVDALFGLFLGLQFPRLFTDAAARAGSGVTYAEAAHRGFGEISVVVSLAALLVCALDRAALRGRYERRIRLLIAVLMAESLLMLASAAFRLAVYQEVYGYSVLRVYVQIYLALAALGLGLLWHESLEVVQPMRLLMRVGAAAVLALVFVSSANVPAWVAAHNVERRLQGRELDVRYLNDSLGPDAVPTVEKWLPRLGQVDRELILCQYELSQSLQRLRSEPSDRWFEWNLRRMSAVAALRRLAALSPICAAPKGVP